jgi:hypothetical protein
MTQTLQLNALNFARGLAVYDERGNVVDIEPFIPRHRGGCIFLHDDGTYEVVEYPMARQWHGQFVRLLDAKIHNAALRASLDKRRKQTIDHD